MHVVLVHPQIAANTGNIIRLCANTGATLHLVEPLGFALEDRLLKRAGLDYHEHASIEIHADWTALQARIDGRRFGFTSEATMRYDQVAYTDDDWLIFGAEQPGLPASVRAELGPNSMLTIPMRPQNRSLNLANAVALVVYEAWRQADFVGASQPEDGTAGLTSETPGAPPFDH